MMIFLNFCAVYEAHYADNIRTLGIWFDEKLLRFMQRTTSPLSEGDSSVCNQHLLQSSYLIHCQRVEASDKNVRLGYKQARRHLRHKLVWPCEPHQWLSAAAHVTCQSSTASVRWNHGSSSEQCCILFQIFHDSNMSYLDGLMSHKRLFWGLTCNMPFQSFTR